MSAAFWASLSELASTWRSDASVEQVAAQMPSKNPPPRTGIPKSLEFFHAGGVSTHLLRVASAWAMGSRLPFPGVDKNPPGLAEWLENASIVQAAYLDQVGWIRAQLPQFPILRLPQLVVGAPLLSDDNIRGFPWFLPHFSAGNQTRTQPGPNALVSSNLLGKAAARLLSEMRQVDIWVQFADSQAQLTRADQAELSATNVALRQKLRPELVDSHEPSRYDGRMSYRASQLSHSLETLTDRPRQYADAFDRLNNYMTLALDSALNHLVEHGLPHEIGSISDIDLDMDEVSFDFADLRVDSGDLVYISDPIIDEVGIIGSVSHIINAADSRMRCTVHLLHGAREGFGL